MVSIPDWTKFQRLQDGQRESSHVGLDRYYKQREEDTLRQAETQGLLRIPTQDYLITTCSHLNGKKVPVKDVTDLKIVRLCGVHIRKVGAISYCTNIRICILSNNHLTKIDALAACRMLIKLDLHGNQITMLPGVAFWSGFRRLRFLFLHDNPIGKYENLQNLATCPNLAALTMYDTPLSLKRNYRHHVVNSLWSLKALDNYVISDEEIIEDAVFGGHFSTKHPVFKISLVFNTPQDFSVFEELQLLMVTQTKINQILSHNSPVLIVQKFIRGYLARKRLGGRSKSRTADSGIPYIPWNSFPSSSSPVSYADPLFRLGRKSPIKVGLDTRIHGDIVPPPPSSSPALSVTHEVSLQGGHTSSVDSASYQRREQGYEGPFTTPLDSLYDEGVSPAETPVPKKRKNLHINLAKLEAGTFSSLYDEQIAVETISPPDVLEKSESVPDKKKKKKKKEKERVPLKRSIRNVKQFFGPVIDTPPPDMPVRPEEDDDIPVTEFRLRGFQPNIMFIDPTTEMILSRQEAGRIVRDAEVDHHRRLQDVPPIKHKFPKKGINNDQRMFARVHGTMGMSCLFAVHQAYRDREKAERTATKMEHILTIREERERAKDRIKIYHEEKRAGALKQRDADRSKMLDLLEKREMTRLNYIDRRQEFKHKSTDMTKTYRADYTFITEFSNQHTSVSNALMRHDRQSMVEDKLQAKSDLVQNHLASEQEQQEVVKKYLEHRQLMRQTESAMARAALDTRMLQEANERMMEAKSRVAQQKARRDTVQAFYPLPVMTPVPTANSAPPTVAKGLSRWESGALVSHGRIGKHPTMVQ